MSNRKEEILIVALHLFARDGYEAVSVSQIAGELDMTKGALYRHYKSKRDIFDCIVQRMEQRDGEQAEEYDMPQEEKEKMPEQQQIRPHKLVCLYRVWRVPDEVRMRKMDRYDCKTCCYYDRLTGLCGVCMKKILKELKVAQEVRSDGDRQNEPEGDEQTVR